MRHLALHDPDSSVQEKAMALKYGRQKKIQIIDGHQGHNTSDDSFASVLFRLIFKEGTGNRIFWA
jgi:hypothetical protein